MTTCDVFPCLCFKKKSYLPPYMCFSLFREKKKVGLLEKYSITLSEGENTFETI